MTAHYLADTSALELGRPDAEPLASESIDGIVDLIAALIERGNAYAVDGDVYFRVRSDADYGSLSHRAIDEMNQGEGVEGSDRKEDPLDFALWKAQKQGEDTAWDAPWGRGRPGWHIECSAMAEQLLGVGFEIHGGGNDLAFPHHENEAAQTRMGRGAELAQIWMHNGMLQLEGGTMGKSLGNAIRLHEVVGDVGRDALIMLFASAHYRGPMDFDDERLAEARARVARIRDAARQLADGESPADMRAHRDAFFDALAEDFNTSRALGALFEWIREANRRDGPVGRDDLVEMLDRARAREPRRGRRRGRARGARAARAPPGGARREGLGGGRRDCATSSPRAAGRCATGPTAPSSCAARRERRATRAQPRGRARGAPRRGREARRGALPRAAAAILYGRNPVHEALRAGRRRIERVWATEGAAREPWLREVRDIQIVSAGEIESRCGSPDHQGICAEAGGYPYAGAAELLAVRRSVHRRARRAAGPAEPRRDLPHRRVRGRDRRRALRAPRGRASRRPPRRRRRARSSTCGSRACATWRTSSPTPRPPAAGATAPTARARRPTTSPTTAAASCSCSAARAAGCGRASRRPATP